MRGRLSAAETSEANSSRRERCLNFHRAQLCERRKSRVRSRRKRLLDGRKELFLAKEVFIEFSYKKQLLGELSGPRITKCPTALTSRTRCKHYLYVNSIAVTRFNELSIF